MDRDLSKYTLRRDDIGLTDSLSIKTEVWIHNVTELWEYDTVPKIGY